jgi:hypothetical protein
MSELGFRLEKRGSTTMLAFDSGYSRPATSDDIAMVELLDAGERGEIKGIQTFLDEIAPVMKGNSV